MAINFQENGKIMRIRVFIENEGRSNRKNIFNEKTLEYIESTTVTGEYPYPYGFILNTTGGDGDNVDCFVVTGRPLKSGQVVECEPVGLMEQTESSWERPEEQEEDHTVLAVPAGKTAVIDEAFRSSMRAFVLHIFDHIPGKSTAVGKFLGKEEAIRYILKCSDTP
jgi:inorganic pyrophosphatase